MTPFSYYLLYLALLSFVCFVVSFYDKLAAGAKKRRVPERALLTLGFLGGAIGEYATMLLIRHKTKHKNFMILLPLFSLCHIALGVVILYFYG